MIKILVLCTGNSTRSQMMQGYLNHFGGDDVRADSAGIETHGLNPFAVGIMSEDGVDIRHHTSNLIDEFMDNSYDVVLTVCDHAKETCPYFPATSKNLHHSFDDPNGTTGTTKEVINEFRRVRDEIKSYSQNLVEELKAEA